MCFAQMHEIRKKGADFIELLCVVVLMVVASPPNANCSRTVRSCAALFVQVCVNQTCVSIDLFIEPGDCPTNNVALTCSGHGVSRLHLKANCVTAVVDVQVCSNINTCHCESGWTGHDCSQKGADEPGYGRGGVGPAGLPPVSGAGDHSYMPKRPLVTSPPDTRSVDELMKNTTKLTDYGKKTSARVTTRTT